MAEPASRHLVPAQTDIRNSECAWHRMAIIVYIVQKVEGWSVRARYRSVGSRHTVAAEWEILGIVGYACITEEEVKPAVARVVIHHNAKIGSNDSRRGAVVQNREALGINGAG